MRLGPHTSDRAQRSRLRVLFHAAGGQRQGGVGRVAQLGAPLVTSPRHRSCGHRSTSGLASQRQAWCTRECALSSLIHSSKEQSSAPPCPNLKKGQTVLMHAPAILEGHTPGSANRQRAALAPRPSCGRAPRARAVARVGDSEGATARDEAVCARAWLVHLQIGRRGGAAGRPHAPKW
jgi:hypothetical protein